MTTQYTPTLKLALPVTGELSGTWGDVVNDNITSMIEQAIAGLATINSWTGNAHTLTTANGTTSESRCAMLVAATGGGAPSAAAEIICPAAAKLYVLQNNTSYAVTLKTSAGTGVAVAAGDTAFLFCDGTNVNSCVTTIVNGHITGNLTVDGNATINGNTTLGNATSDTVTVTARVASNVLPSADNTYDLGASANAWKDLYIDGTATMALVAISGGTINGVSIGATTPATFLAVDNLSLNGNTIASTDTNGNVVIAPNGTGDVQLDADTVRVGDSGAAATLTSNGAGALTVTTGGAADLTLSTNSGTDSGTVVIANGANGNITLTPNGTGDVILSADRVQIGDSNTDTTLTTNGTGSLNLTTNNGTNSGTIQIAQGANGNITLTPNGTGSVSVPKLVWSNGTSGRVPYLTTGGQFTDDADLLFDGTTLTVNSLSVTSGVVFSGGTANGVVYLNGSKQVTTGSAFTFNGTNVGIGTGGVAANAKLEVVATTGEVFRADASGGAFRIVADQTNVSLNGGSNVINSVAGTEIGRFTSTGLGIGTSSPTQSLDVNGNVIFRIASSTTSRTLGFTTSNGVDGWTIGNGVTASANQFVIYSNTAGAARMLIDSSGNVGIGTSSPNKLLTLYSSTNDVEVLRINANGGAGGVQAKADIGFGYYDGVTEANAAIGFEEFGTASAGGNLLFKTRPDGASASTRPTERMRISSAGKVGIGTDAPDLTLDVYGDNGSNGDAYRIMVLQTNNASAAGMGGGIAFGGYYGANRLNDFAGIQGFKENSTAGDYAGALRFTTRINGGSPTERMRITSAGNLGVGNTVQSNINYQFGSSLVDGFGTIPDCTIGKRLGVAASSNSPVLSLGYYSSAYGMDLWVGTTGLSPGYIDIRNNEALIFRTNTYSGTARETMRISNGGNLTVGATASYGRIGAVQAGKATIAGLDTTSYAEGVGGTLDLGGNYRASNDYSTFVRIAAEKANATNGDYGYNMGFYVTTNNGATMGTKPMTLTSTGLILLGGSTSQGSGSRLQVSGSMQLFGSQGANGLLNAISSFNTNSSGFEVAKMEFYTGANIYEGQILFSTKDSGGTMAERARIDSSGRLIIGNSTPYDNATLSVTSPSQLYSVISDGGTTGNRSRGGFAHPATKVFALNVDQADGVLAFYQNGNTERARIDSSGNLLVGTTTNNGKLTVYNSSQVIDWSLSLQTVEDSPGSGNFYYVDFRNGSFTQTGYIWSNGGTTTSYATSSDYRLKENIAPITGALKKVAQLKPSTWSWKANGQDGQGFIAHELQAVCPDAVSGEKDGLDKNGNPRYQAVDTSFLVATLTAAIQEQQAIIESLKARLDAANL